MVVEAYPNEENPAQSNFSQVRRNMIHATSPERSQGRNQARPDSLSDRVHTQVLPSQRDIANSPLMTNLSATHEVLAGGEHMGQQIATYSKKYPQE